MGTGFALRFLALAALLLAFVPAAASAASKSEAEVTLRFWNQLGFEPLRSSVEAVVGDFNAQHPRIHVEVLHNAQLEQKLLTAVAGNVAPDVAIFDRFRISGLAHRGALEPLDESAARAGIARDDFFPVCWDECVYDGRLYGVPYNTDVRVLYYNKAMFRQVGLDPERPPRTWKELREYSEKLTLRKPDGSLERVGFVPYLNFGNTWLYLFAWQKNAQIVSPDGRTALLDAPEMVEALEWVRDFVAFYGATDLRAMQGSIGAKDLDPFMIGRVAMIGEEVFLLSRINKYAPDLDFGIAPLPWPEDGVHATWSGGFGMIVPRGAKHPAEAAEFIKYMTSAEAMSAFGERASQLPANRRAVETPFYGTPHWQAFIAEMPHSRFRPAIPAGGYLWESMSRAWDAGGGGRVPPREALEAAQKAVQGELDRVWSETERPVVPWSWPIALFGGIGGALLLWRIVHAVRRVRALSLGRGEAAAGYAFAAPVIAGLLVFTVGPIAVSAFYSFCSYDVLNPPRWAGLYNYRQVLVEDPLFAKTAMNTLVYTVAAVPSAVAGALLLALLLNVQMRGRGIWRTLFYLPSIVPVVALSMLFMWLFSGDFGLFNIVLKSVGLPGVPWMTSPRVAKLSLALMNLWTVGGGMIIFLAALQGVPRHLHEAAVIDGAGPARRFLAVTFPMISPSVFFLLVTNTIGGLQVFTQSYLMTKGTGEPEDSTLFLVFQLFRRGFVDFNMGNAAAMAWVIFAVVLVATVLQFQLARLWVHDESR